MNEFELFYKNLIEIHNKYGYVNKQIPIDIQKNFNNMRELNDRLKELGFRFYIGSDRDCGSPYDLEVWIYEQKTVC